MPDTRISILIVEDEAPVRSLLTDILSPMYQCSSVENAGDALRLMQVRDFHLALVDVGLPGMSGLSLCRLIVNRSPGTAVVVLSGDTDEQSVAEALKAGASDYITKPFDLAHALETVALVLRRRLPGAVA
jgi:DNA-binding response OmpR family regulator